MDDRYWSWIGQYVLIWGIWVFCWIMASALVALVLGGMIRLREWEARKDAEAMARGERIE